MQAASRQPAELEPAQPFAFERKQQREVPAQHVDLQLRARLQQRVEKLAQRLGKAVVRAAGNQPHAAVDVPAENEYVPLRAGERGADRTEILASVDQESDPRRVRQAPAIASGHEQTAWITAHPGLRLGGAGFEWRHRCRRVVHAVGLRHRLRELRQTPSTRVGGRRSLAASVNASGQAYLVCRSKRSTTHSTASKEGAAAKVIVYQAQAKTVGQGPHARTARPRKNCPPPSPGRSPWLRLRRRQVL